MYIKNKDKLIAANKQEISVVGTSFHFRSLPRRKKTTIRFCMFHLL